MNRDPIDPESLAAFLEGRLDPSERAALLERLAREPDLLETFAEAAAVEQDLADTMGDAAGAESGTSDKFRPLKGPAGWRWAVPTAAAAAIAALLFGRALLRPAASPVLLADASTLLAAAGAPSLASALGENWTAPAWTGMRGGAATLSAGQRAFRIGSRLAVLGLAADAGDVDAAQRAAVELRELLVDVEGGAPLAARLDNIAARVRSEASPADATPALDAAASDLEGLTPAAWLRAGAWVEQARLAARAGAVTWFAADGPAMRALPGLIEQLGALGAAPAEAAARRLEALRTAASGNLDRQAVAGLIPALDEIASEAAGS